MAISYFSNLSDQEIDLLTKAPALVTIYIAGADDDIHKNETEWASKLVRFRTFTSDERLHDYYEVVHERFQADLNKLIEEWQPQNSQKAYEEELANLKSALDKIDDEHAQMIRQSLRSLAEHVAKAAGGFLRMGAINKNEHNLISLDMLGE